MPLRNDACDICGACSLRLSVPNLRIVQRKAQVLPGKLGHKHCRGMCRQCLQLRTVWSFELPLYNCKVFLKELEGQAAMFEEVGFQVQDSP